VRADRIAELEAREAEIRALYRAAQQALVERDDEIHRLQQRRVKVGRARDDSRGWRGRARGFVALLEPTPLWRLGVRRVPGRAWLRTRLGL